MHIGKQTTIQEAYYREHNSVITHTRGLRPEHLLSIVRPYEGTEIQTYRNNVYKPVTMYPFLNCINDLHRIMKRSKMIVSISEQLDTYVGLREFQGKSLFDFFVSDVLTFMLEDPNGALVYIPYFVAENQPVRIDTELIASSRIKERSELLFEFWLDAKSYISIDPENVSLITDLDNGSKEVQVLYVHNLGFLPVVDCRGIIVRDSEGQEYNKSFLSPAVAWGDEVIRQTSDYQATQILCGSPIREIQEMPCTNKSCQGGKVYNEESKKRESCSTCNGTGTFIPTGSFSFIIRKKGNAALGDNDKDIPALRYVTLDTAVLREQREALKEASDMLEKSLNQVFTQDAQSAVAKREDRQQKQSMLDRIGTALIKMYEESLLILQGLVFRDNETPISIILPPTFAEITEDTLRQDVSELRASGTPQIIVDSAVRKWIKKSFGGDEKAEKIIQVLDLIDPYYTYSFEEKQTLIASMRASEEEIMKSDKYIFLIKQIMREDITQQLSIDQIAERAEQLYNDRFARQNTPIRDENGNVIG